MIKSTAPAPPKIDLVFYQSSSGNEPVRDWLFKLPETNRHAVGLDLQRVQFRWPVGMPLVRPIGKGLFEVRTTFDRRNYSTRTILFSWRRTLRAPWLYQKVAEDA